MSERIEDLCKEIVEWHVATFPNATEEAMANKLLEELGELVEAANAGNGPAFWAELSDVVIVATAIWGRQDPPRSFPAWVREKLEVNRRRVWGKETANGDRPRDKTLEKWSPNACILCGRPNHGDPSGQCRSCRAVTV